jgi:hypothetical protein
MRRAVSGCSHFEENGTTFDRDLPYQQPLKERLLAAKKHPSLLPGLVNGPGLVDDW